MSLDFTPQIDADPEYEDFSDEQNIGPVPNIYLPKLTPVHVVPSQRAIYRNVFIASITAPPVKVCDQSEIGIGARVTLQLHAASTAAVAIGSDQEHLSTAVGPLNAAYGLVPSQAYVIPFLATAIPAPLIIATCQEIWAVACGAAGHAMLSILVEQFYGDN